MLVNIYGPNQDSSDFLNDQEIIEELENETIIICDDFNLVQNQDLDTLIILILIIQTQKNRQCT